jgi:glycosyltransferase involved in cell wall biosynthesis
MPRVSVCVPTHDGARWVSATLHSVLAQTYRDFEVVVSDDRSVDGTLDVVRAIRDPRIRIVGSPSRPGAAANWNHAVRSSAGDLVKLLCQDDLLAPGALAAEVAVLDTPGHEDAAFTWFRRDVVDSEGRRVNRWPHFRAPDAAHGVAALARVVVRSGRNPVGEPLVVTFRRSAYDRTAGFRGDYVIDLDMWLQLASVGPGIAIPATLGAFRVSPTSWSNTLRREQHDEVRALHRRLRAAYPSAITGLDAVRGRVAVALLTLAREVVQRVVR